MKVPEIEYVCRVRDVEYDKYILRSEVIFSEEMAEAIGPKFKRVVEDELVKRMLDQIRESIAISQVPVDDPLSPRKHYRATLLILREQLKNCVTY